MINTLNIGAYIYNKLTTNISDVNKHSTTNKRLLRD